VVDDGDDVEELADVPAPGPRARLAAAAGADQLPVEDGELVSPAVQCQSVWLCQRYSRCGRFARVRLLWSDDSYGDCWSQCAGERGAISLRLLLHISEGPVPLCEAELPPNCTELVHTSEVARLTVEAAAELWLQHRAPAAGAHPFEDLFGELDEETSAPSGVATLRSRLMESKDRFAALRDRDKGATSPAEGAAQAAPAVEAGPKVKRPLAEVLSERAATVARGGPKLLAAPPPSDGGSRGARDRGPTEDAAATAGASRAAQDIASALARLLDGRQGSSEEMGLEGVAGADGSLIPRGLMSRRAHCRRVAIELPARLAAASLARMADFLGAQEGESAVDPQGAIVLRRSTSWCRGAAAVADLLAQRFKALQVALHDGNWSGAKRLEIAPPRDEPTALRGKEEELIRGIQAGELKLDEPTAKLRKPRAKAAPPPRPPAALGDELAEAKGSGGPRAALAGKGGYAGAWADARAATPKKKGESTRGYRARLASVVAELKKKGATAPTAASGGQHHGAGAGGALPPLELGADLAETVAPRANAAGAEAALLESLPLSEVSESMAARRRRSPAEFGRLTRRVDLTVKLARFAQLHPGTLGRLAGQALPFERLRCRLAPVAWAVAADAWTCMSVLGSNHMYCGVAWESPRLGATPTLAQVARWVADPALALKAEADFPDPLPKARVNVGSEFEWEALTMQVDLGIFTVLPAEELVRVRGGGGHAGSTSWASLRIPEGKLFLWSGDDQKGAFFAWRAPRAWHRHTAAGRPLAGSLFGRQEPEVHLASAVIAMGWSLAAAVYRHIHRRLRRLPPPPGAGLPPQAERRKDAPRPVAAAAEEGDSARWQIYTDDFDAPEIVEEVRARRRICSLAEMQVRARASYDRAGVAYSAEKAHCRQLRVERMGVDVDGEPGRLAAPLAKSLEAIALCLASFRLEAVPWRLTMTIFGRFARLFEFRRPLLSVLNEVWRLSSQRGNARFSAAMVGELLTAMLVMTMAATSLRAKIEGMAAVSDASEFGGGARAPMGLRAEVEASLGSAPTLDEQMHLGARLLQLPAEPTEPWTARRVVRLRWPGANDWGDATRVTATVVNELRGAYCDEVDLSAAAAGSPCQDLARLNASGAGLRGAKPGLFYEAPLFLELLKAALGHMLKWFVENVASTTADNWAEISRARAFLACSSVLVPCQRPSLRWMSWGPHVAAPLAVVARGGFREVRAPRGPLCELAWQDEGARWLGAPGLFPTLACCRPLPKLPSAPRGPWQASAAARARWEADSFGYHAALHERNLLLDGAAGSAAPLEAKALSRPLEVQELAHFDWHRPSRDAIGRHESEPGGPDTLALRRSVLHYLARAEKGGTDVRPDCGLPYRPRGRPRSSLEGIARRRRAALSMARPAAKSAHVNVRELQAAAAALRWRARKASRHGSRWPHLFDSRVGAAIVTKGRSSSRRLQPALARWAAVAAAADMHPVVGYVVSEDNPADEPSRRPGALRAQSLFLLRVDAATRHRHSAAVDRLLEHYGVAGGGVEALGQEGEGADALVSEYLEVLWASGAGIAAANNAVAGARFFSPHRRGHGCLALEAGCVDVACLLTVAFEGLLRGGEAFALCRGDVAFRGQCAVLRIASSKASAGRDAAEAVVIRAPIALQLLRLVTDGLDEGDRLSARSPRQLRAALAALQ
ncbi:unnamed protein product, partial [Prorocentrum cordatum]